MVLGKLLVPGRPIERAFKPKTTSQPILLDACIFLQIYNTPSLANGKSHGVGDVGRLNTEIPVSEMF